METPADAYSQVAEKSRRDELITEHLWLVRHVMGKTLPQLPPGVDAENLGSAGILGLVEAASNFDPARGVSFSSFAYSRIRGALLDELRRNCPLPQLVIQRVAKVRKAYEELQPPIMLEDLVQATGLSSDEVADCLAAIRLTRPESCSDSPVLLATLCDERFQRPDSAAELAERKQVLTEAIMILPESERLVVTLYYLEDLRLKEIGQVLGLSESRVSRLLSAALFRLGEYLRAREM